MHTHLSRRRRPSAQTNMSNGLKSSSISSCFTDHQSIAITKQNILSFQRISNGQSPTRSEQSSYIIMNTNDHEPLTRSIIIESAVRQGGFLPHDYRLGNTFESIRRQRIHHKALANLPPLPAEKFNRTPTRSDAFGNFSNKMSKLAQQRLILRERASQRQQNLSVMSDQQDKLSPTMSEADFATDIPSALELLLKKTKKKSTTMERHLSDMMKRERVQQGRYRLLPISRAPIN